MIPDIGSWLYIALEDVVEFVGGVTPPRTRQNYGGSILICRAGDLGDWAERYITATSLRLWPEGTWHAKSVPAGCVIVSRAGTIGALGITTETTYVAGGLVGLKPRGVDPRFLYFALMNEMGRIKAMTNRGYVPGLRMGDLRKLTIPLPEHPKRPGQLLLPLGAQAEIADWLERTFDATAAARATAKQQIAELGAVEGRLQAAAFEGLF